VCRPQGRVVEPHFFGRQRPEKDAPPLRKDAMFLVASITKPVTVTGVMMLVERGEITLSDKVSKFVPRFAANGKDEIQVRHLMTHSSGLPDQLPDNIKMRMAHKPLSAFIDATCELSPLYPPGRRSATRAWARPCSARSSIRCRAGPFQEFLRQEIFDPLGMKDTSLGWQAEKKERLAQVRQPKEMEGSDWGG